METKNKVKFYKSKTKIGALLIGVGPVLVTIGGILNGSVDFMTGIQYLLPQLGVVAVILGFRDLPFINKSK